ncbi:hypothetical protein AGDE_07485 [Angomonas deanei]|nr:hypothetical protein AGDE_07485 [Angomonas deanei]|eukprot:EPY35299.1 hypothetical protein AGDE_07485 [Angomonas deanei]
MFSAIGFRKRENTWVFEGTMETLHEADAAFTAIENKHTEDNHWTVPTTSTDRIVETMKSERERILEQIRKDRIAPDKEEPLVDNSKLFCEEDYRAADPLKETVRKTLLNTGRIRNCFFDACDFTTRKMIHGCVYECGQGCTHQCIEAHWHLITRNIMYSYIAHISEDGTKVLHLGTEFGYQYNSTPGTPNFRKTLCFSAKQVTESGALVKMEHPNKAVTNCLYCNVVLISLLV